MKKDWKQKVDRWLAGDLDVMAHITDGAEVRDVPRQERKENARAAHERVLETAGALSLLSVSLRTGRSHQIRVQFAARGLPLLGDVRYGSRDPRCEVSLRACYLRFLHPETGKPMEFFLPPPREYPWDLFDAAVYEP